MIENKTGSLMAASCEAAAILLKVDEKKRRTITEYGMNLGLTYQIVDDVIDQDSAFTDNEAMLEKAEELGNFAIQNVSSLQTNTPSSSLIRLVEYILHRIEDLREEAIA